MERIDRVPETRERDLLDTIRHSIATAEDKIAEEFGRTDNDWFSCYVSRLTVLNGDLSLAKRNGIISESEFNKFNERFESAHSKLKAYRKQYPNIKKELPPEDVREELLKKLNVFED